MAAFDNPFYIQPVSPLQALMTGVGAYQSGVKSAKESAAEAATKEAAALQAAGDTKGAIAKLMAANNPELAKLGVTMQHNAAIEAEARARREQEARQSDRSYGLQSRQVSLAEQAARDAAKGFDYKDVELPDGTKGILRIERATSKYGLVPVSNIPTLGGAPAMQTAQAPGPAAPGLTTAPAQPPPGVNVKVYRDTLSKEAAETAAARPKAETSTIDAIANLDRLAAEARAIKSGDLSRITGPWGMLPSMPGGEAADLESRVETLKSQVGFGVLQAMREASKTGGALGALSEGEGKRLEANLASLNQKQGAAAFSKALDRIIEYAEGSKGRLRDAFKRTHGADLSIPSAAPAERPATAVAGGGAAAKPPSLGGGSRPAAAAPRPGQIYVHPQTGKQIQLSPDGTRWIDVPTAPAAPAAPLGSSLRPDQT